MLLRVKADLSKFSEDSLNYEDLGMERPEDEQEIGYMWVGLTPMLDIRFIYPNEDGKGTKIMFRDGLEVEVFHEMDDLAHNLMGSMGGAKRVGEHW